MATKVTKASAKASVTTPKPVRKATFTTEVQKGVTIFRPVNKRAKKWAKHVGKRTRLVNADIREILSSGKVKVAVYQADKTLKLVK
jgi:hypothetical protein